MIPTKKFSHARLVYLSFAPGLCLLALVFAHTASAQKKDKNDAVQASQTAAPLLTRTTSRHETRRFGYGGSITLIGAPQGSITIESWQRNEVDLTADIELRAATEEDLTQLAAVNGFILDEEVNHLRILTTGTHDKAFMKRTAKNFPKRLFGLPWKIDYHLRVPAYTDIEVNTGSGPLTLKGVEGTISINAIESNADLTLAGGLVRATIERGSVNVRLTDRNWRGAGTDIRLASGDMTVWLVGASSLEINADILRSGQIENSYNGLEPRDRTPFTPRSMRARAGAGGPTLAFTVGDGTLRLKQISTVVQ
jgi:hypothetical protein